MADTSRRSSSLEDDPLHAYSGLSLFPRTLKSLSNPLPPPPLHQSEDPQQTHTLLESMPFEIQNEHQEQAKAILEDINVDAKLLNPIPNKRERRPGLDPRQRKSFSLDLPTSQPPPALPSFGGSKIPRPEEYFAEYDKYELANREWHKQTGTSVIDTQQNPPARRPRRPGLQGRKRPSFMLTSEDGYIADDVNLEGSEKEIPVPSEKSLKRTTAAQVMTDAVNLEASEKEIPIPSEQSLKRTTAAQVMTADREVDDSTVDTDKDLSKILHELLACSRDELEGGGAIKILEDRLNVKPFVVEDISEVPDVRKMDLKASGRNPSNRKSVLSNIQNMLKGTPRDAVRKNSYSSSPLMKEHISSPNPPNKQFSFPDIHNLLPGDHLSNEVDIQPSAKDLNIGSSSSLANDADKDITNTSPSNVGTVDAAKPFNSSVEKNSGEHDSGTRSGIHRFHSSRDGNAENCVEDSITNKISATLEVNLDMQTLEKEGDLPMSESGANSDSGRRENDADISEETEQLERLAEYGSREVTRPLIVEEDSILHRQGSSSKSPNRAPEQFNTMDGSFEHAEPIQGQQEEENDNRDTACGLQVENPQEVDNSSRKQRNKRKKRGSSDSNMKKRSKTVHGETGGDKQMATLPHESGAKKQTKKQSNEREEKKQKKTLTREAAIFSRRKSLAGAGTKMEGGIRRSTRIKSRPLEFWRGERFLYGRIHESLTTVIGIKYGSPGDGKSDKRASKVKSYVSDDYKDLVDFAALH
ncbi:PREDICTED: uncharacterized protein LOC104755878 isoform X2 [Camelina sativa]|uniref:Uncharacterized protein LOC104755878 isoform X2 n=1 Tax=Camelina sativa TaxID=90675 RepID=A0ABM0WV80_CAMSA|nr:PREDICTED: uncharacterized protein LOC104755878 isoform X2 [Camelina sativa]